MRLLSPDLLLSSSFIPGLLTLLPLVCVVVVGNSFISSIIEVVFVVEVLFVVRLVNVVIFVVAALFVVKLVNCVAFSTVTAMRKTIPIKVPLSPQICQRYSGSQFAFFQVTKLSHFKYHFHDLPYNLSIRLFYYD